MTKSVREGHAFCKAGTYSKVVFGFTCVATWRQHSGELDERLHIIEIADPDQPAG
jgi:hypothetical protein